MTRPTSVLTAGVRLILGCLVVGTLAGVAMAGVFYLYTVYTVFSEKFDNEWS